MQIDVAKPRDGTSDKMVQYIDLNLKSHRHIILCRFDPEDNQGLCKGIFSR